MTQSPRVTSRHLEALDDAIWLLHDTIDHFNAEGLWAEAEQTRFRIKTLEDLSARLKRPMKPQQSRQLQPKAG